MAKPSKPKRPTGVSPKGVFKFPNLIKPDFGTKEFPKPDGEYNVRLVLPMAEAQPLIDKLQPLMDQALQEAEMKFGELPVQTRKKLKAVTPNDFYAEIFDKTSEEPTGEVEFKFKAKAGGKNKDGEQWERKIPVFDAKGKPANLKAIWGGTIGKVSYEVAPYFVAGSGAAGITLYLQAVQVIELRQGGDRSAGSFGFGEEDGFDASDEPGSEFGDESEGNDGAYEGGDNEDF